MLCVEVIIYQFCGYLFCIYILLCTCDGTRGTLCNIISQFGTCIYKYVTVLEEHHFQYILCASCNVCKYVCVLCFNYIYAKVYFFVCHATSVNIYMCVCVLCFNFIYAKVYFVCDAMSVNVCVCVLRFNFIYVKVYFVCHKMSVYSSWAASIFIVLIVRVYVYMLKHYEKVLYIMCHACICLHVI